MNLVGIVLIGELIQAGINMYVFPLIIGVFCVLQILRYFGFGFEKNKKVTEIPETPNFTSTTRPIFPTNKTIGNPPINPSPSKASGISLGELFAESVEPIKETKKKEKLPKYRSIFDDSENSW